MQGTVCKVGRKGWYQLGKLAATGSHTLPSLLLWLSGSVPRSLLSRLLETSGEGQIQSRLQGWVILLHTGSGEVNSHANRGINLDDSCT